jgi:hypothetical protein
MLEYRMVVPSAAGRVVQAALGHTESPGGALQHFLSGPPSGGCAKSWDRPFPLTKSVRPSADSCEKTAVPASTSTTRSSAPPVAGTRDRPKRSLPLGTEVDPSAVPGPSGDVLVSRMLREAPGRTSFDFQGLRRSAGLEPEDVHVAHAANESETAFRDGGRTGPQTGHWRTRAAISPSSGRSETLDTTSWPWPRLCAARPIPRSSGSPRGSRGSSSPKTRTSAGSSTPPARGRSASSSVPFPRPADGRRRGSSRRPPVRQSDFPVLRGRGAWPSQRQRGAPGRTPAPPEEPEG